MIVLGLLLILFAVGATVVAVTAPLATAKVIELSAVGVSVKASPLAMFLAGAISVVLLGVGFALISQGTRRKARRRRELRELRKDQVATPTEETTTDKASTRASTDEASTDATTIHAGESSSRRERLHDGTGTDTTGT